MTNVTHPHMGRTAGRVFVEREWLTNVTHPQMGRTAGRVFVEAGESY